MIWDDETAVADRPDGAAGMEVAAFTVMVTVAELLFSAPSFTRKVKLVVPDQPMVGVKVRLGAVPLSVPLAGLVNTAKFKALPSGSLPVRVMFTAVL